MFLKKMSFILELYKKTHPERLANAGVKHGEDDGNLICTIFPDVYIHPSATVHHTAVVCFCAFNIKFLPIFLTFENIS